MRRAACMRVANHILRLRPKITGSVSVWEVQDWKEDACWFPVETRRLEPKPLEALRDDPCKISGLDGRIGLRITKRLRYRHTQTSSLHRGPSPPHSSITRSCMLIMAAEDSTCGCMTSSRATSRHACVVLESSMRRSMKREGLSSRRTAVNCRSTVLPYLPPANYGIDYALAMAPWQGFWKPSQSSRQGELVHQTTISQSVIYSARASHSCR